ncbi:alpha/beta hydrolase [Roseiarcaceae bacterium H3SJ34-1]|uniref:alpha/beta hydrolase n=1 Tax=Terripilifer ovatus TaxID=3032367 RepID=UPI003AB9611D|nr:alpha/beta hydrolase [Roseiarcaceae bacterium H3SJ34-1]
MPNAVSRLPARALIEALGRSTGQEVLQGSQKLLARLHGQEPYEGVRISRDVTYGPDQRHRLDIYAPSQAASGRPVLMFVHGGGFLRGDKKTPGLPFFENIGVWAVRNGMVGVNITYRRLPQHPHPAGIEDVAAAIAWVKAHIGDYGGDGARILLYGSSAGAALIASYVASPSVHTREGPGIAGLIVSSGYYDFAAMGGHETIVPYFGEGAERFSSLDGVVASGVPVVVTVGEFEQRKYQEQALLLATALFKRNGEMPKFIVHAGHNHYTSVMGMGLDDNDPVLTAIRLLAGV